MSLQYDISNLLFWKDYQSFLEQLGKVRAEQMVPLCTASVELGSYKRGYDYVVRWVLLHAIKVWFRKNNNNNNNKNLFCRLHMLHELEEGVNWLLNSENSHSQTPILHNWETRSNLIQVLPWDGDR